MHHDEHHWGLTWLGSERLLARRVARPVARFLRIEAAGGVLLLASAFVAVVWANSPWQHGYHELWHTELGIDVGSWSLRLPLHAWVNDALMALFFFVVGMEIKREVVSGELRDPKAAALPVIAAAGGMVVPALIFAAFNAGGDGAKGWGIPMATDIAFAVGVVSLLGPRVPAQLKLFLLTLAVADDLGAIAVIAAFYTESLAGEWLLLAAGLLATVVLLRRAGVHWIPVYAVVGVVTWYAMLRSGVHATIAGVLLGFLTPSTPLRDELDAESLADRLENKSDLSAADVRATARHIAGAVPVLDRLTDVLHPWTSFVIIPVFALANAGVSMSADAIGDALTSPVALGVAIGLVVGKTIGVFSAAMAAVKVGVGRLPRGVTPLHMLGISTAAGIGFTVALFVTALSFEDPAHIDDAKVGIFAASFVAAGLAWALLSLAARRAGAEELALEAAEDAELFMEAPTPGLDDPLAMPATGTSSTA